jgi:hypothetical protein
MMTIKPVFEARAPGKWAEAVDGAPGSHLQHDNPYDR